MTHQYLGEHKPTADPAEALAKKYGMSVEEVRALVAKK